MYLFNDRLCADVEKFAMLRCADRQCTQRAHAEKNAFLGELRYEGWLEENGHMRVNVFPVCIDVRAEIDGGRHFCRHDSSILSCRNQVASQHRIDNFLLRVRCRIFVIDQKIEHVVAVRERGEKLRAVKCTWSEWVVGAKLDGLLHDDVHWTHGRGARFEGEAGIVFVAAVRFIRGLPGELERCIRMSALEARVIRKGGRRGDII